MTELFLTCGCSGAGKSTKSEKFTADKNVIRISSDALRAVLGKDETDQTVSGRVFQTMETMTEYLLKHGYSVLIDATNYSIKNRSAFVKLGRKYGARITAFVFNVPLDTLKARNAARARVVPEDVIERQFNGFVHPTTDEVDIVIFV